MCKFFLLVLCKIVIRLSYGQRQKLEIIGFTLPKIQETSWHLTEQQNCIRSSLDNLKEHVISPHGVLSPRENRKYTLILRNKRMHLQIQSCFTSWVWVNEPRITHLFQNNIVKWFRLTDSTCLKPFSEPHSSEVI